MHIVYHTVNVQTKFLRPSKRTGHLGAEGNSGQRTGIHMIIALSREKKPTQSTATGHYLTTYVNVICFLTDNTQGAGKQGDCHILFPCKKEVGVGIPNP